jgi:hypothetical protein
VPGRPLAAYNEWDGCSSSGHLRRCSRALSVRLRNADRSVWLVAGAVKLGLMPVRFASGPLGSAEKWPWAMRARAVKRPRKGAERIDFPSIRRSPRDQHSMLWAA